MDYRDGLWHMATLTWDGTNTTAYIDGSSMSTNANVTGTLGLNYDTTVGSYNDRGSMLNHFEGVIDEVGIWSRELTSAEVTELYNSGAGLQYPYSAAQAVAVNSLFIGGNL